MAGCGSRAPVVTRLLEAGARTVHALFDLILPRICGGCDGPADPGGICPACAARLAEPAIPTRPVPAPAGLPPCLAGGPYAGPRRELILAYKERGRRDLATPLGAALAEVVRAGWPATAGPVVLVPVPDTAAAIRARHGDHMLALARVAARRLRAAGYAASAVRALRARPKADSAELDRQQRVAAARDAFALLPPAAEPLRWAADAGAVVVCDDVLTTGATLSAVALRLLEAEVPVAFAATLAATRRHGLTEPVTRQG